MGPGGSTLSRSIFAFLKNRDNTNVDSNPTKTTMNLKKIWLKENFQIGPQQTERGTGGEDSEGRKSTRRANYSRMCNSASNTNTSSSRQVVCQRVSPRLSTSAPPAPRRLAVPASFAFSRLTCWILV